MENIKHLKYFLQALFLHIKRIKFYIQNHIQLKLGEIDFPKSTQNYWKFNEKTHINLNKTKIGTWTYVFNVKFLHPKFR